MDTSHETRHIARPASACACCAMLAVLVCAFPRSAPAQQLREHRLPCPIGSVELVDAMSARGGVLHLVVRGIMRDTSAHLYLDEYRYLYYLRLDSTGFSQPVRLTDTLRKLSNGYTGEWATWPAQVCATGDGAAIVAWSSVPWYRSADMAEPRSTPPKMTVARMEGKHVVKRFRKPETLRRMELDSAGSIHLLSLANDVLIYTCIDNRDIPGNGIPPDRRVALGFTETRPELSVNARGDAAVAFRSGSGSRLSVHLLGASSHRGVDTEQDIDYTEDVCMDDGGEAHLAVKQHDRISVVHVRDNSSRSDSSWGNAPSRVVFDRDGSERGLVRSHDAGAQKRRAFGYWRGPDAGAPDTAAAWLSPIPEIDDTWCIRTPGGRGYVVLATPKPEYFAGKGGGRLIAFTPPKQERSFISGTNVVCADDDGTIWISSWGGMLYEIPPNGKP